MDLGCGWWPMDVLIFFWVLGGRERERERGEWRRKQRDGKKRVRRDKLLYGIVYIILMG